MINTLQFAQTARTAYKLHGQKGLDRLVMLISNELNISELEVLSIIEKGKRRLRK